MLRIGITGGIGSGKTTVCDMFALMEVPVYNADAETKAMYNSHPELRQKLIALFGETIYSGPELNRAKLGELVFSDKEKLAQLNAIVHPMVFDHYENWCKQHADKPYTIKEAAIMFESGSYKHLHFVVGVIAPMSVRIQRVMHRDSLTEEAVKLRIQNQMHQDKLQNLCDFTIENDGRQSVLKQVIKLHAKFIKMAESGIAHEFKKAVKL